MTIAAGGSLSVIWRTDGATISFTPVSGSTVTFSVALDKIGRAVEMLIGDDLRTGNPTQTINNLAAATTLQRGGVKHIQF